MRRDIVLCGTGGQGTVLASRLLATAAMRKCLPVKTAETIGMAQRGGSVLSHVRVGEGVASPLVGSGRADVILAFEPAEAARQLRLLKLGGAVVVSNRPVVPVSAVTGGPAYDLDAVMGYLRGAVSNLTVVDADAAARELGSAKVLNVLLLGAATRTGALGFTVDEVRAAVHDVVPERFLALNDRALDYAKEEPCR
ncbi:indolepyruvate oxidoreductase subunit beta [Parafannyhessea umbonata]|uniref:Indolepyruvate ferredoxin oxidoreductase beta subunit n=1 Tax=Parafannyhessea umbonata TaxID=604330 RepID=A0A1G6KH06_9ACTN|nr:indolepyruvate oxidoreductase subunit beta [Parafannyhessea umbonata]SDC30392.1 indolepyruvate ferredoxin oxidoreductase beta subunit [Parafannyhessea umbonata]